MYKRQVLVDQSPMSIKQVNDNFSALFLKLSGNIDTMDLRPNSVTGDKIAPKVITGEHILDGTLTIANLESDFVSGLDLLENAVFTSLTNDVKGNASLIQQNAEQITLQASNFKGEIARLDVKADNISSTVSSVQGDVNTMQGNISRIDQKADSISSTVSSVKSDVMSVERDVSRIDQKADSIEISVGKKVDIRDMDDGTYGEEMISSINLSRSSIQIKAKYLELDGITTLYDPDDKGNHLRIIGSNMYFYNDYSKVFGIYGARNTTYIDAGNISTRGIEADGLWSFTKNAYFEYGLEASRITTLTTLKNVGDASFAEGVYLQGEVKLDTDCRARGLLATYSGSDAFCIEVLSWGFRIREWDTRMERWGDIVGDVEWSR